MLELRKKYDPKESKFKVEDYIALDDLKVNCVVTFSYVKSNPQGWGEDKQEILVTKDKYPMFGNLIATITNYVD